MTDPILWRCWTSAGPSPACQFHPIIMLTHPPMDLLLMTLFVSQWFPWPYPSELYVDLVSLLSSLFLLPSPFTARRPSGQTPSLPLPSEGRDVHPRPRVHCLSKACRCSERLVPLTLAYPVSHPPTTSFMHCSIRIDANCRAPQ